MNLAYSRFYAKYHPDNVEHRRGLTLLHQRMLAPHLPADRSVPILDVGCGRGFALQDLAALGYTNLRGIDTDPDQAAFARGLGIDATYVEQSEFYLAAHPKGFAVVLLLDVLEHVPREAQPEFLRALSRSLRPGGRLICSVPNAASSIAGYWQYNDYTHHLAFTEDSLGGVLEQTGFRDIRFSGPEFFPRPRFTFWLPTGRSIVWWLRCVTRWGRRAALIGELGWGRGRRPVLTPNLLAVADKAE
jgi:SAM-dependent methyltransferase